MTTDLSEDSEVPQDQVVHSGRGLEADSTGQGKTVEEEMTAQLLPWQTFFLSEVGQRPCTTSKEIVRMLIKVLFCTCMHALYPGL